MKRPSRIIVTPNSKRGVEPAQETHPIAGRRILTINAGWLIVHHVRWTTENGIYVDSDDLHLTNPSTVILRGEPVELYISTYVFSEAIYPYLPALLRGTPAYIAGLSLYGAPSLRLWHLETVHTFYEDTGEIDVVGKIKTVQKVAMSFST